MQAFKTELEIQKLMLENSKLRREIFWYPVGIAAAMIASISGATVLVLKLAGII